MKRMLLMILLLLGMPFVVNAEEYCTEQYIADLKIKASMITANQNYVGNRNFDGNYQWYELTFDFQGLDGQIFIASNVKSDRVNNSSEKLYLESGKRTLNIYSTYCAEYKVGSIEVNLLKFNEMSLSPSCVVADGSLEECDPWNQDEISSAMVKAAVEKYYDDLNEGESFFSKYFLFIILGGVACLIVIILLLIRRYKRNRLD